MASIVTVAFFNYGTRSAALQALLISLDRRISYRELLLLRPLGRERVSDL